MELRGGGKGKENDRASTILKYTSVKVEDITMCIKLLKNWGWEGRGKGE
jgi:hypothetical protein